MTKIRFAALALALAGVPLAAHAGAKFSVPLVHVDPVNGIGWGALGSARNSADTKQYVGCEVRSFLDAGVPRVDGGCYFANPNGQSAYCFINKAAVAKALDGLNADSFVMANWDSNGECTYITVGTGSYYAPKAP